MLHAYAYCSREVKHKIVSGEMHVQHTFRMYEQDTSLCKIRKEKQFLWQNEASAVNYTKNSFNY